MTAIFWILAGLHVVMWLVLGGNFFYLRSGAARGVRASSSIELDPRSAEAKHSSTDLPMLSIMIPARNEEMNLRRLLPSLESQRYPKFEVIVYDDGSTDNTGQVLRDYSEQFPMRILTGEGPPPGWVGKVNALYQGSRIATGEIYLFLDADTELLHETALTALVASLLAKDRRSALTVLPYLTGGGLLLVSLIPHAILTGLPWPLVRFIRTRLLGAVNGQAWMIRANDYHGLEPHEHVKSEVLEDVNIGRYLVANGITPVMIDATRLIAVHMYSGLRDAWRGFRKNAYLLMGGSAIPFLAFLFIFAAANWLSILFSPILFMSSWGLKFVTDRIGRMPLWTSAIAPISFLVATVLQIDSAVSHWRGSVVWKGRNVR